MYINMPLEEVLILLLVSKHTVTRKVTLKQNPLLNLTIFFKMLSSHITKDTISIAHKRQCTAGVLPVLMCSRSLL